MYKKSERVVQKMKIKSGTMEQFGSFSQYQTLKEFKDNVGRWLLDYKSEFTKGELVGLTMLVCFSTQIPGVCHVKIATFLKAIREEGQNHGISRDTFKRMIKKAKAIGILTVYETVRENGSQSSNLYVFNQFPS